MFCGVFSTPSHLPFHHHAPGLPASTSPAPFPLLMLFSECMRFFSFSFVFLLFLFAQPLLPAPQPPPLSIYQSDLSIHGLSRLCLLVHCCSLDSTQKCHHVVLVFLRVPYLTERIFILKAISLFNGCFETYYGARAGTNTGHVCSPPAGHHNGAIRCLFRVPTGRPSAPRHRQ